MIKIYSKTGIERLILSPTDSSTQSEALQGGDYISLQATHQECVSLEVNDYADFCGRRYWVAERYTPREKSSREWSYSLQLLSLGSLIGRYLVRKLTDGENEPVFSLTAPASEHVALIVACLNEGMATADWKVGSVDATDNITLDYNGTYCDSALESLAKKAGSEWWIEGTTVNLCRCEHGEPVELGYRSGLRSLEQDTASNVKFFTRLFPSGSSRNINRETYGAARLQLPGRQKYIEQDTAEFGVIDHYESAAFADIYPRRIGRVGSVRAETRKGASGEDFTVYYFTDPGLDFDPNDYEIPNLVKRISFQEGSELAGQGNEDNGTYYFEVNFNSSTREFEIITIWPGEGDTRLPGGLLIPHEGDSYILWNIQMPESYITAAEVEYEAAVCDFMASGRKNVSVYKARTDSVEMKSRGELLTVGRRICLKSPEYFPGTGERLSRLTRVSRRLNNPWEMDIEISDVLSRSTLAVINDNISEAVADVRRASGALPDIIRTGDRTQWTDNNLLSALRSGAEFLSKKKDDTAASLITFLKGLVSRELSRFKGGAEFGEFVSGMMTGFGGAIDSKGNAEVESLIVRSTMQVMELIINRIGAQEGDTLFSESDTIETLTDNGDGTWLLKLKSKYDGYFTAMTAGMVIKGVINDLASGGTDYYTSWMRVNSVNASANTIEVSIYPDSEVPAGRNFPPCELMKLVRWGHQTDTKKQSIFYISSTEGRIVKLHRVDRPIIDFSNFEFSIGTFPEKISELLPIALGDSGIFVDTLVTRRILQLDSQDNPLPTIRDRGPYDPAGKYYSGDTVRPETNDWEISDVWYLGCRWRCKVTGTTRAPGWNVTDWTHIEGNSEFRVEFEECPAGGRIWLDPDNIRGSLTIIARVGNENVTADIPDSDIEWTRYTEDADGNPQVASDNIWALGHASVGRQLTITAADFSGDPLLLSRAEFRARVTLRDGMNQPAAQEEIKAVF